MRINKTKTIDDKNVSNANSNYNSKRNSNTSLAQVIDNRNITTTQRKLHETVNQYSKNQDTNKQYSSNNSDPIQKQKEIRQVNVDEIGRMKEKLAKIVKDLGEKDAKPFVDAKLTLTRIKMEQDTSYDQDHVHKFAGILNDARDFWKIKFDQKECPY